MPLAAEVEQRLKTLGVDPDDLRPFFCATGGPDPGRAADVGLGLCLRDGALSLMDRNSGHVLAVDFLSPAWRHRASGHLRAELLVKAVFGRHKDTDKPLRVIDATAGLGRDAWLLALSGARVMACERHPVVYALLSDGLRRAASEPALAEALSRLSLQQGDFADLCPLNQPAEVIYLDPMFPLRNKSARVKKDMQLLHRLLGAGQDDADAMLHTALAQPVSKVVVKRPRLAKPLGERSPTSHITGKASRFDVYAVGAS